MPRSLFRFWPLLVLAALITGPLLLRPRTAPARAGSAQTLVIISPHNETIRHEISRGFEAHCQQNGGRRVRIDWRTPGGTSEIARFLESEYVASFQHYWRHTLRRPWSGEIERAFADPKLAPAKPGETATPAQAARQAFLDSGAGCGIDLFFGGGSFDFMQQAAAGRLVDGGVVRAHPELFRPEVIPQSAGGEPYWDPQGRWVATCLSAFGICYNTESLRRLGLKTPPRRWSDLAAPAYARQIAVANPMQSGSVNKAFEMLIQQQMLEPWRARPAGDPEAAALEAGWASAMRLILAIGANARYFSDAASRIALDVAAGEAAAGMAIDFYGRFESEAVRAPDGTSRLAYVNAEGGTSFGADPVALLRGAPHPELAREFMEWALSPGGQKLWNWKVGTEGGPERYALRRLPILPQLYAEEFRAMRSDPDINPYASEAAFTYHGAWTGPLFKPIAFIVRVMCVDPHDELVEAWRDLCAAGQPPEAAAAFFDVSAVDYTTARGSIRTRLGAGKLEEVRFAKELGDRFRAQYRRAAELARQGR